MTKQELLEYIDKKLKTLVLQNAGNSIAKSDLSSMFLEMYSAIYQTTFIDTEDLKYAEDIVRKEMEDGDLKSEISDIRKRFIELLFQSINVNDSEIENDMKTLLDIYN